MSKKNKYLKIISQLKSILSSEKNLIANLANTSAVIQEEFDFLWTGFYLVEKNELVLGPFQGPLACTRIQKGRGVCGDAWEQEKTIIVQDVHEYPGHIACSSLSNSEIVVPIFKNKEVIAVLDIDSIERATFDEVDREMLELLVSECLQNCFER